MEKLEWAWTLDFELEAAIYPEGKCQGRVG